MEYKQALIIGKRRRTDAAAPGGAGADDAEVLAATVAADEAALVGRANRKRKAMQSVQARARPWLFRSPPGGDQPPSSRPVQLSDTIFAEDITEGKSVQVRNTRCLHRWNWVERSGYSTWSTVLGPVAQLSGLRIRKNKPGQLHYASCGACG